MSHSIYSGKVESLLFYFRVLPLQNEYRYVDPFCVYQIIGFRKYGRLR